MMDGGYLIFLVVCVYFAIRNHWVYTQRLKLIDEDFDTYRKLPSYDAMMIGRGFWRWDIEYFIRLGETVK